MRLSESLYIVGGGANGLGISESYDSAVYLIDAGSELALVDSGCGIEPAQIAHNLEAEGLSPARVGCVLLTHCHADHAGGAWWWREQCGARVIASRQEAPLLESADEAALGLTIARANGSYPPDYRLRASPVDTAIEGSDRFAVGGVTFTPIHVPGHSRGSICYLAEIDGRRCLFAGDVVFCGGWISLLNCPGSSLSDYRESIGRLAGLGVDALLPGHFGFTLGMGQAHIDAAIRGLRGMWPPRRML
jgi:glyoxylase-like metal-dependent hydrolase (beta-lactamase superfamily II)